MRFTVPLLLSVAACTGGGAAAPNGGAPVDAGVDAEEPVVEAGPSCVEPAYPQGPYGSAVGATISDRTWPGVTASGTAGTVALHDALAGCPGDAPVLVVRIDAAWCGTCLSYAAHSKTLLASDVGPRVRPFDVILLDRDNAPASTADAPAWQALEDIPTETGVDPMVSVQDLLPSPTQLPVMLVIDAATMVLHDILSNPTEDALEQSVRTAWAAIDGQPAPSAPVPVLADGRFTRDEWALVSQMALTDPPGADPSNAFADSIAAAALGGKLFSDMRLSPSDTVACSSCHGAAR